MALTAWTNQLCDAYGLFPTFAHVDKDMVEIGMLQSSWNLKIQLCWWHMCKAIQERLSKAKLSTTPYDAKHAHAEFAFIHLGFTSLGSADTTKYEGGNLGEARDVQSTLQDLNAVHIHILLPQSFGTHSSTAPPAVLTLPRPQPVFAEHANRPINVAGKSRLTIKLLAHFGEENQKCEEPNSAITDSSLDTAEKQTFCPADHHMTIVDMCYIL